MKRALWLAASATVRDLTSRFSACLTIPGVRQTGTRLRMEHLENRLLLTAISWDGGGDGSSWGVGANWSGPTGHDNTVPGPNDDVTIDVGGNPTITVSSETAVAKSLTCAEALVVSGGSLTVGSNGASLDGTTTVSGG